MNDNDIPSRLKLLRETLQQNSAEFARNIGIPRSTYVGYEQGIVIPVNVVITISEKFDVSTNWLLTGIGDIFEKRRNFPSLDGNGFPPNDGKLRLMSQSDENTLEAVSEEGDSLNEGIVEDDSLSGWTGEVPLIYPGDERLQQGIIIPFLGDQAVSAGYGEELEDEDRPVRYFRVPAYLGHYPNLAILPVRGDSMDPTLHDGDMVVCDGGGWDGDGIYVIKTSDKSFVKRVVSTSKGYQVISDNQAYPSYGESKEDVTIVGKVRAALIAIPGRRGGI